MCRRTSRRERASAQNRGSRLPENTLESFKRAFELGADFLELDLVSTRDGVLVARHGPMLSSTTDVAHHSEFADRRSTKPLDNQPVTDWFVEDFTVAELKQLRVVQREPARRPARVRYDGRYEVPTLQETIDLVRSEQQRQDRPLGIAVEIKRRCHFARVGFDMELRGRGCARQAAYAGGARQHL